MRSNSTGLVNSTTYRSDCKIYAVKSSDLIPFKFQIRDYWTLLIKRLILNSSFDIFMEPTCGGHFK